MSDARPKRFKVRATPHGRGYTLTVRGMAKIEIDDSLDGTARSEISRRLGLPADLIEVLALLVAALVLQNYALGGLAAFGGFCLIACRFVQTPNGDDPPRIQ